MTAGDVNRDGYVRRVDLMLVQAAQGAMSSWTLFDPDLGASPNGYIGQDALNLIMMNMGRCRCVASCSIRQA